MPYEIIFANSAKKDIEKLDGVMKNTIKHKLLELQKDPLTNAKKLHNHELASYRWRIGNYRILFDLEKSKINILKVAHRREVYKDY